MIFFRWILERKHIRKKLFKEIAILDDGNESGLIEQTFEMMASDPDHSVDAKVSAVLVQAWKHFKAAFQRFNHIILKAPADRFWNTTDNPVIVHNMGQDGWVAGPDAEIYFPISKDFLLYLHVDDVKKENPLIGLEEDKISEISTEIFDHITMQVIIKHKCEYHVIGEDIGFYNASTEQHEDKFKPPPDTGRQREKDFRLMSTAFPPALDDPHLTLILKRLKTNETPIVIDVQTHEDARENECIEIVDKMVSQFGGERVLGWQIWQGGFLIEAEFHAVWRKTDDKLLDVSFKKNQAHFIVFIPDPSLIYTGRQINNIRLNTTKNPVVDDFIRLCNCKYKLFNKGKRAGLYGHALWDFLTLKQKGNIKFVLRLIAVLEQFLESGADDGTLCFCGSGRKYKNCHARQIKMVEKFS